MNTAEILHKAADVIDERGWSRGKYQAPDGSAVCALGAISVAAGLDAWEAALGGATPRHAAARWAATEFRAWLNLGGFVSVSRWNDEPERTAEQVTSALRECAAALAGGAP